MKRTLTLALSAVLGGGFVASAFAQDNFPDAPENHWAFEALLNMKRAGLLVGYPDGLFRGGRPASRYELAVAIHATYQHLKGLADGLGTKIAALEDRISKMGGGTDTSGFATKAELQALRDALNATNAAVNGMKSWGDDIAALKRMTSTFERELASLGVDVESMKKGLADLANRVAALEKRKLPVDIHGTMNLLSHSGYSIEGRYGVTREGRPTGVHKGNGSPTGVGHSTSVWEEGALTLSTTNEDGPKGTATIALGNTLAQIGSSSGSPFQAFHPTSLLTGVPFGDTNEMDIWIQKFEISTKANVLGADVDFSAGRIGLSNGAYSLMKPDTSLDYKLITDGHDYMVDGAKAAMHFGNVGVNIFAGRTSARFSSDGTDLWPMMVGNFGHAFEPGGFSGNSSSRPRGFTARNGIMADQLLGVTVSLPLMEKANLNLQYQMFDSDTNSTLNASPLIVANRMTQFGADFKFPVGGNLEFGAGYSQTNLGYNQHTVVDEDNAAWYAKLAWHQGDRWGFHAGYRQLDPQFAAPGYWGRIGMWWNPVDIKGFNVGAWFNLSDRTMIGADAQFNRGADNAIGTSVGLIEDDKVNSFRIHASHKVSNNWTLMGGGEWVMWDLASRASSSFAGGEPRETWWNFGAKFNFNENSWWSIMWEQSDYDGRGVLGFAPFSSFSFGTPTDRATGGKITSQFSIKY